MFGGLGMKLNDEQKTKHVKFDYDERVRNLHNINCILEMCPTCMECKKYKVLPMGTTSSLPISPLWSGNDKTCIMCAAKHWDYYSSMDGISMTPKK